MGQLEHSLLPLKETEKRSKEADGSDLSVFCEMIDES